MNDMTQARWSTTPPDLDLNKIPHQFTEAQEAKLNRMFAEARANWKECPERYKIYDSKYLSKD